MIRNRGPSTIPGVRRLMYIRAGLDCVVMTIGVALTTVRVVRACVTVLGPLAVVEVAGRCVEIPAAAGALAAVCGRRGCSGT